MSTTTASPGRLYDGNPYNVRISSLSTLPAIPTLTSPTSTARSAHRRVLFLTNSWRCSRICLAELYVTTSSRHLRNIEIPGAMSSSRWQSLSYHVFLPTSCECLPVETLQLAHNTNTHSHTYTRPSGII